ncbi:MAG: internalin, putative [Cytophagales bacterium]|jgi:hypothetical protein|nr:gliding motility-associated C-terminal domain-containing protein [Bacteroidota bacterium]MBS1980888.1 gliding motility-associated C-terminal domain-containing protein [Bacteroidota bacterium]WHZ08238.1 MAG: internalin, putative [Cytophagales bacterium]
MKKIILVCGVLACLHAKASHIVGGEFELLHVSGYTYQFNMILYFDDINGEPGSLDNQVTITIFRKRDNLFIANFLLPLITRTRVAYTQPACSTGLLETDRIFYSATVTLSASVYNDAQGYYASWQRCCRNYNITNIFSEDPNQGGIAAGQTFYMEFPPVVMNGEPFVNSSPHLFPPLSDYGCPGRPYYVNFGGVDDDNDSLVYSLVTPLNTSTALALPAPSPAPYPLVQWRPGFSLTNIIQGNPDLRISHNGFITCTPTQTGLFVFAVKVEQYRNRIKIGETRRDFQLLVVNGCQPDLPPQIVGKKLTDATFTYSGTMNVSFSDTVKNATRCINVSVSDPDTQDPLHNYSQTLTIRAVALNFKKTDISSILPSVTTVTLTHGATHEFTICFPQCPFINGPYQIGIVVSDGACSLPLMDTLKVTVHEQPPPNTFARFLPPKITTAQLNEGSSGSWPFAATDDDGDNLIFTVVPVGFSLSDAGMAFNFTNQQPGNASGTLSWKAFCKIYNFTKQTNFTVRLLVDDQDLCNIVRYDTATFNLSVQLPDIHPQIKITQAGNPADITATTLLRSLGQINFNVIGMDNSSSGLDTLALALISATGNVTPKGFTFTPATGIHYVESPFAWTTDCSLFSGNQFENDYVFTFAVANHYCKTPKADTTYVKVNLKDIESNDADFRPGNVITTLPDHCNDFFAIDGFDSEPPCPNGPRQLPLAPADNCSNRFEYVRIYDRWGKLVFQSSDRMFRWYAQNESSGVYYSLIKFTNREYKNWINVIR